MIHKSKIQIQNANIVKTTRNFYFFQVLVPKNHSKILPKHLGFYSRMTKMSKKSNNSQLAQIIDLTSAANLSLKVTTDNMKEKDKNVNDKS